MTGKPVRVVRGAPKKRMKHIEYLPKEGFRYDGLYKICNVWAEKGESKYLVWRYLLRRDDDEPAPWTEEGTKIIQTYNLKQMAIPEGVDSNSEPKSKKSVKSKKSSKIKKKKSDILQNDESSESEEAQELLELIKKDTLNQLAWNEILKITDTKEVNRTTFVDEVMKVFKCTFCLDICKEPRILPCVCKYNACKYRLCFKISHQQYLLCFHCRTNLVN